MHHDIAQTFVDRVEEYLQTLDPNFKLSIAKFYDSTDVSISHGGLYKQGDVAVYGIEIAMNFFISNKNIVHRVYEHPDYDRDKTIGGFYTSNYLDGIRMTICHEMAHAFQYFLYNRGVDREPGHGRLFRSIYRPLRKLFVNPHLPPQKIVKEEYLNHIRKIELCEKL